MIKFLLFFISLVLSSSAIAKDTNEYIIPKGTLISFAPPVINKDYFAFDFGFITEKKIKQYEYNAYVTGTIFQDWEKQEDRLRAGGLGFRGGVILPFQPWIPLLFTTSIGFAKTVLHKSPFLGSYKNNVAKKDMLSIEAGLLYRIDKYFIRANYQVSNVKYFTRHAILTFGVYY